MYPTSSKFVLDKEGPVFFVQHCEENIKVAQYLEHHCPQTKCQSFKSINNGALLSRPKITGTVILISDYKLNYSQFIITVCFSLVDRCYICSATLSTVDLEKLFALDFPKIRCTEKDCC